MTGLNLKDLMKTRIHLVLACLCHLPGQRLPDHEGNTTHAVQFATVID
jgi:hypothetical protein